MKIEIRNAQNLSYREKQVVTLKESGIAAAKIAKKLNLAESTIATLYNRARAKGYETVIIISGEILALYENNEDSDE
jgi:helix-turn-helix protein